MLPPSRTRLTLIFQVTRRLTFLSRYESGWPAVAFGRAWVSREAGRYKVTKAVFQAAPRSRSPSLEVQIPALFFYLLCLTIPYRSLNATGLHQTSHKPRVHPSHNLRGVLSRCDRRLRARGAPPTRRRCLWQGLAPRLTSSSRPSILA